MSPETLEEPSASPPGPCADGHHMNVWRRLQTQDDATTVVEAHCQTCGARWIEEMT